MIAGRLFARFELLQCLADFGQVFGADVGAAFVAGIAHAVEPATAAFIAGQFRRTGRILDAKTNIGFLRWRYFR